MTDFAKKYGPWAIVTGASSGLGMAFAREIASRGVSVVLVARRSEPMEALAADLEREQGVSTRVAVVDLAREDLTTALVPATDDLEIGLLVNNAGFSNTGDFVDNPLERELELLHVNCRAPLILAHRFGRAMRARGRGGIIFTSSVAGFAACPTWTNYAASKSYDLLFAEGLALELAPSGVDVVALCPGATRTGFQSVAAIDVARMPGSSLLVAEPGAVARTGLDALGRETTVVHGMINNAQVFGMRFLPRWLSARMAGSVIGSLAIGH